MNASDVRSSWSHSLEDLVCDYSQREFNRRRPLGFTPKKVRNPAAYERVPSVLVVASAATRHLHRAFFESLELLEKSSGAFKVSVFAEAGSEGITKGFDWAVEHCFSEGAWWSMSGRNWLEMASARLEWAQEMYGASYVLAARSVPEATAEIARLGTYFNLDKLTVSAAQAHMEETAAVTVGTAHSWVRGWLHELSSGTSEHGFDNEALRGLTVSVCKTESAIALVTRADEHPSLEQEAQSRGWNVVTVQTVVPPEDDTIELALRRAIAGSFSPSTQVFQALESPVHQWDPQWGTGALTYSQDTHSWVLRGVSGLQVERGDVPSIAGALESVSHASILSWAV